MSTPQVVIRVVPRGGTRTTKQLIDQLTYLLQKRRDKEKREAGEQRAEPVTLELSERHQAAPLPEDQLEEFARSWAMQTGNYQEDRAPEEQKQDLTTHLFVSFPPKTPADQAHATGRAWVEATFGSGNRGGSFDYVTAFHTNRAHPHLHIVVNRRSLEGDWLKISRDHPQFGYRVLRESFVDIAHAHGMHFEATSRAERNILPRPVTYAQYRRDAESAISIENDEEEIGGAVPAQSRPRTAEALEESAQPPPAKRRRQDATGDPDVSIPLSDLDSGGSSSAGAAPEPGGAEASGSRRRAAEEDLPTLARRPAKRRRVSDPDSTSERPSSTRNLQRGPSDDRTR